MARIDGVNPEEVDDYTRKVLEAQAKTWGAPLLNRKEETMTSDAQMVNVQALTTNQPFCAGVILCQQERVLVTLNTDGLPAALQGSVLRVGGVGGGQEVGETISRCALREAQEELDMAAVHLIHAPLTYVHDWETGELSQQPCSDDLAPFLLERQRSRSPDTPYRPGLPTGPYVYFGLFFARAEEPIKHPGDDVQGLLWLPIDHWPLVEQHASLEEVLNQGAILLETEPLPGTISLWAHPNESMRTVTALLSRHPELSRF